MQKEVKLILQQVIEFSNVNQLLDQIPIGSPPPPPLESSISIPSKTMEKGWPTVLPGDGYPNYPSEPDETLALLLPLLILLTTLLFLLLIFLLFLILVRKKRGIVLRDEGGPLNLEQEDQIEGEGGLEGVEQRWLEGIEEPTKVGYLRGKVWQSQYPPNSHPTDITLSQFLSIQEKGVSAWSFEPDYESNPALIVQSRTEITFLADGIGMAEEEGGGCCVQSNLPLPRLNEVYYFECKMYEKPIGTEVAIGLATKPFPSFRLPGWSKYSVGYFSSDGFKSHSYPFTSQSYGPPLTEGDVLGVGYRPRTGTVFFTRNGKKLEDAYVGLNKHNLFPTVGANGAATIHVNLGQAGFVFIEANVKKWGLAPMIGTLAPPPAYGSERGSILLETANNGNNNNSNSSRERASTSTSTSSSNGNRIQPWTSNPSTSTSTTNRQHRSRRISTSSNSNSTSTTPAGAVSALGSTITSAQPIRPSPLRHSRGLSNHTTSNHQSIHLDTTSTTLLQQQRDSEDEDDREEGGGRRLRNPPTPGLLDISLHSLHHGFPIEVNTLNDDDDENENENENEDEDTEESEEEEEVVVTNAVASGSGSRSGSRSGSGSSSIISESSSIARRLGNSSNGNVEPPAYYPIDPHRYAPGVGEALLEDVFANVSGTQRQFAPNLPSTFQNNSTFSEGRYEAINPSSTSSVQNIEGGSGGGGGGWLSWIGLGGSTNSGVSSSILPISNNVSSGSRDAGSTR